jgi:hypothetical protein
MITASFKVFSGRNVELLDSSASGDSINSCLIAVKKRLRSVRAAARKDGQLDPLRNWSSIELFLHKRKGHMPLKKDRTDAV